MAITYTFDIPLTKLSTFRIGGVAKTVVTLDEPNDVQDFFIGLPEGTPWFLLGGGSNIVFPDGDCETLLVRLANTTITIDEENEDDALLRVGAGALWDDVVRFAVEHNLAGIEALSAIPGSAGATPVQNVGAYGVEIRDVLVDIFAYNVLTQTFVTFTNEECKFGYRDSIFKNEGKGRYVIVEMRLALSKDTPNVPQYPGVAEYLAEHGIRQASLADIREAITTIRWKKLPDPKDVASVGSFFKNPFVTESHAHELRELYPNIKLFPGEAGLVKVPAGWLIEHAGFKGQNFGTLSVYKNNALVLVNEGGATRQELTELVAHIIETVQQKFNIKLTPEPELLVLS